MSNHEGYGSIYPAEMGLTGESPSGLRVIQRNLDQIQRVPKIGDRLSLAYAFAIGDHPKLKKVALHAVEFPGVTHELLATALHMGTGARPVLGLNTAFNLNIYRRLLQDPSPGLRTIADYFNKQPRDLSPEALANFYFLHDLG